MEFIWGKTNQKFNAKLLFKYRLIGNEDLLSLCAGNFYTVYFDDKLVSYGPERTAAGYSKIREIPIPKDANEITVLMFDYLIPSFDVDNQPPFFGAEIFSNGKLVAASTDFEIYESNMFLDKTNKYSYQRGFIERFDLRNIKYTKVEQIDVEPRIILKGIGDTCSYKEQSFDFIKKLPFTCFDEVCLPNYMKQERHREYYEGFDIQKDFLDEIKNEYICYEYCLKEERSGLLKFDISSIEENVKVFIVFDEYLENGKWKYGRSSCNDLVTIDVSKGKHVVITSSPYSLKHMRILMNKEINIIPSIVCIENNRVKPLKDTGDEKLNVILSAARNTFMQNAVDIYTDCPGRERAGWLCDSYFLALAEHFFTGNNKIEKCFLENFILGEYEEIEKGMLPMAFPACDDTGTFIPNWAMWFVLELEQYYLRTKDSGLVDKAKTKVYELVKYFEQFENEYSLLENLRSWVFVEWSAAGTEDFIKGVSFPTNMLYAEMLKSVSRLYKEDECNQKAQIIIDNINKLSWNGHLYIDNTLRIDGVLKPAIEHTSETCQYYALFFNINSSEEFISFIKNELGPLRKKGKYPEIPESNSFIGNYLRFLWLKRIGEKERIKKECIDYFYPMAKYSGTLWEKNTPNASCNHGFASSIAAILFDD